MRIDQVVHRDAILTLALLVRKDEMNETFNCIADTLACLSCLARECPDQLTALAQSLCGSGKSWSILSKCETVLSWTFADEGRDSWERLATQLQFSSAVNPKLSKLPNSPDSPNFPIPQLPSPRWHQGGSPYIRARCTEIMRPYLLSESQDWQKEMSNALPLSRVVPPTAVVAAFTETELLLTNSIRYGSAEAKLRAHIKSHERGARRLLELSILECFQGALCADLAHWHTLRLRRLRPVLQGVRPDSYEVIWHWQCREARLL
eukprot:gene23497-1454_t